MKTKLTFLALVLASILHAQSLAWTSPITNSNNMGSFFVTTDGAGNVFNTGYFSGTADFDPGAGTYTLTSTGPSVYLRKLDPSGNLLWAVNLEYLGTGYSSSNGRYGLCSDLAGDVYVVGFFSGTCDFDPGVGVYTLTAVIPGNNSHQIFVWKLNSNGGFEWAKQVPSEAWINSCVTDASGNLFLGGSFSSASDFDWGPGTLSLTAAGGIDGFISKLDPSGNLVEVKQFSANGGSSGITSVSFDALNNLQALGSFSGTVDADPGIGTTILNSAIVQNFAVRLNSAGNFASAFTFSKTINTSTLISMSQDVFGNTYVAGKFSGTCDFDPTSAVYSLQTSGQAVFLYKLDPSGNFSWAKSFETGALQTQVYPFLSSDGSGRVILSCNFNGTLDCDPGPGIHLLSDSTTNIFAAVLNSAGNFESAVGTAGYIMCTDPVGNFYTSIASGGPIKINKYASIFTGIKTNQKNSLVVSVFPNPSAGEFNLTGSSKNGKMRLEIYTVNGQKILDEFVEEQSTFINLKEYQAGIYMLRLTDESNGIYQQKLIKE